MRQLLADIGFQFDETELTQMIQVLAGAQQQRLRAKNTETREVTRSTAIVALDQLAPQISKALQEANLRWIDFRSAIGLAEVITPAPVTDVDLDVAFDMALQRYAKRSSSPLQATPTTLASAILLMVVEEPEGGKLGGYFREFGADTKALPIEFKEVLNPGNPIPDPDIEPTPTPSTPSPPAEVSTHATSDLWTTDDKLGYAEYARAIFHLLEDRRTEPPLTISIQAPWGGGKTSLMRMVQMQLDPKSYAQSKRGDPARDPGGHSPQCPR